jgi:hypothetical protein
LKLLRSVRLGGQSSEKWLELTPSFSNLAALPDRRWLRFKVTEVIFNLRGARATARRFL